MAADRPVVVALGQVDPALVAGVLGDGITFVTEPGPADLAAAIGAIARADAVVDAALLDRAPRLRVVARTGVGVDLVDLEAASDRGVTVVVTPGSGTRAVAEGVLALALHLVKRLGPLTELVREGRWAERGRVPVGDLDGAIIGIVGYGRIGRRVGELAEAFGMRVLAHDPFSPPPPEVDCPDLGTLAAASDVVTLHAPLTDQTRHLVDEAFLARIRRGAVLVNCGRGGLLDLDAVLAALETGRLAGVGLDVFDPEPPPHHPLFDHTDVVLTPHVMGLTRRATTATFADAAQGVVDVLAGRRPAAVANEERKEATMRLGLLGLGRIGEFHADTLASLPMVDSLVVADIIPELTTKVADRLGAEPAASPDALLRAGLDGVVIAAGTDAHPELIVAAVDAGLPVFCEKPLARTIAEGAEVVARVKASGVPVQIGYQRRFDVAYQAAHDAVAAGELGWLHTVRSTTLDPAPPTPEYVAVSGGIFRDCGVHDFDIIRWVTGQEVVEVYATGSNQGADFFAAAGDVDTSAAVLTLTDGALALVSNTRYNPRGYDVRLEVHGSRDSVAVGLEKSLPLRSVEPLATFPTGVPHRMFMDRFLAAYQAELEVFAELVAGDRRVPCCTVEEGLEADLIAEACGLSLREHRPVRIGEVRP